MESELKQQEDRLQNLLKEWNFELSGKQLEQLTLYYENLTEWNKVMDLTNIQDPRDVYEKHFLDSCSIVREKKILENFGVGTKVIDVGTGAGFPGLVIAILFPEWEITLMDSLNKRINFLEDTAKKLSLENVACIHSRAEDLGRDKQHREKYDLAVSRAVADLSVLAEYCLPFVKKGGYFIPYKGKKGEEEVKESKKALSVLGGKMIAADSFELPGTDYERMLILIRKEKETPGRYPRKAGTPKKEPIR